MKIIIDNPCHENWDAMSPNERGAFCSACQKTVIDFSQKTINEIKNFFMELPQTEKVCGRFEEDQLNEINFESFFNQFRKWNYFRKAAVIMFFIFGFGLFGNAQTSQHPERLTTKGEVALVPKDTIKRKPIKDSVAVESLNIHHIMGGPRYIPEEQPKDKPKKEKLMGKPSVKYNRE